MAAFQWPLSKLEIVNSGLSQTGDNLVAAADNGSEEWLAASPAYERGLAYICESHGWGWLTKVEPLQPAGNVPGDDRFDTAYNLPADLIHLILVRLNDRPTIWDLQDNQLVVNARGGPPPQTNPPAPQPVTIRGIFSTNSDPVNSTPTVVLALQMFVMSGIYRGMHRDTAEADKLWTAGMAMLKEAKVRHDEQRPKRAWFNSRMTWSRRVRRPWRQMPGGWGGSGFPGD